jgi:hypothetical protein
LRKRRQPLFHRFDGSLPRELLSDVGTRCRSDGLRTIPIAHDAPHQLNQRIGVRLKQPRLVNGLKSPDAALLKRPALRWNKIRRRVTGIIKTRPRARDDDGHPTGHRLDNRQAKAFPTKRLHKAIAGAIQRCHLGLAQNAVDVFNGIPALAQRRDLGLGSLSAIKALRAHLLDNQPDPIPRPKCAGKGR